MAFVRKTIKTFSWPVPVEEPTDGGTFTTSTFDATFRRVGRAEFARLSNKGDMPLLKAILTGWDGIDDESGTPIPFTQETMKEFADDPYWMRAVLKAYTATFDGSTGN